MSMINQLTISTHVLRQLVQQGLLDTSSPLKVMTAQGVYDQITVGQLLEQNTQLIIDELSPPLVH